MSKNGVYFDEGDGYLLVERLGQGIGGQAMTVRDQRDGKIYVRKRIETGVRRSTAGIANEVWITQKLSPHKLIPFIRDYYEDPFPYDGCTIIFEYCNGGDLVSLVHGHAQREASINESAIWLIYRDLLLAIAYLHTGFTVERGLPSSWDPILHRDIHPGNVYVRYITGEPLPSIMLGDFGSARCIPNYDFRRLRTSEDQVHWTDDVFNLANILKMTIIAEWESPTSNEDERWEAVQEADWYDHIPKDSTGKSIYSDELMDLAQALDKKYPFTDLPTAMGLVAASLEMAHSAMIYHLPVEIEFTKPISADQPKLYEGHPPQVHDGHHLNEPWYWVKVNPKSFKCRPINPTQDRIIKARRAKSREIPVDIIKQALDSMGAGEKRR